MTSHRAAPCQTDVFSALLNWIKLRADWSICLSFFPPSAHVQLWTLKSTSSVAKFTLLQSVCKDDKLKWYSTTSRLFLHVFNTTFCYKLRYLKVQTSRKVSWLTQEGKFNQHGTGLPLGFQVFLQGDATPPVESIHSWCVNKINKPFSITFVWTINNTNTKALAWKGQ